MVATIPSPARLLVRLSLAGAKRARSALRGAGVGAHYAGWADRAAVCARCPLSVVVCNKSYCGKPLLRQLERDEATQGCGCPIRLKAQDPAEHCPRTARFEASSKVGPAACDCVWCVAARADADGRTDGDGTRNVEA